METLEACLPDIIAAGNIGCMMQIATGTDTPMVHTVELLDWATGGPMPLQLRDGKSSARSLIEYSPVPCMRVSGTAKARRAKCPCLNKHAKIHKDRFAFKDLGLTEANQ